MCFFCQILERLLFKNNYEFHIIGRPLDEKDCKKEVEFYDNCIGSKKMELYKNQKNLVHQVMMSLTNMKL